MKPTRAIKKSSANNPVKKSIRIVKARIEKLNHKEARKIAEENR